MKNRERRFCSQKHPFITDAKLLQNETHEVALTMDQYVSGKTYGFHANKIKPRNTTLPDE